MRLLTVRSAKDWNIVFAKCITSERSGAGTVENKNGSDLIPGDYPALEADKDGFPKLHREGPGAAIPHRTDDNRD
jgi:hypothetical protein